MTFRVNTANASERYAYAAMPNQSAKGAVDPDQDVIVKAANQRAESCTRDSRHFVNHQLRQRAQTVARRGLDREAK